MVRGKVVLARIDNEKKRKASMEKRKAGLLKKVSELSTLCDVEAAVVIYSPGDPQPTVWPSIPAATQTIYKYFRTPEVERTANALTAETYLQEKCRKMKAKAEKLIQMNEERSAQLLIQQIYEGKTTVEDLDSEQKDKIRAFAAIKREELLKHIRRLKDKEQQGAGSSQVPPPAVQISPANQVVSGLNTNGSGPSGTGRNVQSPVAAHAQQMNVRGKTHLAPQSPVSVHGQLTNARGLKRLAPGPSVPTPNRLMSAHNSTAFRPRMTGGPYGQINFGAGMMQRALQPPQARPPAHNMQPSSQGAGGLFYMNHLPGGSNCPRPAPPGQNSNFTAAGKFEMLGRLTRRTNPGDMMQPPLPSPLYMPTNMAAHSARSGPYMSMNDYWLSNPERSGPPLSLPLDTASPSNTLNMAGLRRLHDQQTINSDGMMQRPLPLPSQLTTSGLEMTNNGFVNEGTRLFTGDGNSGGMIRHTPPSYVPPQLGQPPMPQVQNDASGLNTITFGAEWSTTGFAPPASSDLDVSDYGLPPPASSDLDVSDYGF